MTCRIVILVLLLLLSPTVALGIEVTVEVKGLEPKLAENVLATLALKRHSDSPRLTAFDIRRLHRQAEEDIRAALAPYGYYNPVIESSLNREEDLFHATYSITAGEPVLVRDVRVEVIGTGAGRERFSRLDQRFPLQPGDVLHQGKYEEGKKQLLKLALAGGFMRASFQEREIRINRQSNLADLTLVLATGPQFVFGETSFFQDAVTTALLHRYLPWQPGEPYRPAKLVELQQTLYRTDFFSRVVVEGRPEESEGLAVPVTVRLISHEALNRYSFGIGYATDHGARTRFEWRNRLLNERGHKMKASALLSELDSSLALTYEVPWGNPTNDRLSFNSSFIDQTWEDTDTRLLSLGVGLEHRATSFSHGGTLEFRDESYTVGVTSGQSRLIMPTFTSALIWADDLLYTTNGLQLSLSVSGALESVGSDVSFLKGVVGGKVILSPFPGWRLLGRGQLGAALVDAIDDLPPSLRFYAGGDQSIRGYAYRELGTEDASGAVVGGRYLVVGSVEMEKEMGENWSLAAFWDVGNAVDDLTLDFKQGVGLGFRYRLPFGQVRVDVASAILEDGAPLRLHLNVGADL